MSPSRLVQYAFLEDEENEGFTSPARLASKLPSPRAKYGLLLALSAMINLLLLGYLVFSWQSDTLQTLTKYAQLAKEDGFYYTSTDFSDSNDDIADEKWETLNKSSGVITLSDEYARNHDILIASRFPWDHNQGVYVVKGFHDLHCLKAVRRAVREYQQKTPQTQEGSHIIHCLDALRQSIMCTASDDIIPVIENEVELGQNMQCKSWDALTDWVLDPQRNGCYNYIEEFRHAKHETERFAFCPEDSKYYPRMKEYFERHGHRDPWN